MSRRELHEVGLAPAAARPLAQCQQRGRHIAPALLERAQEALHHLPFGGEKPLRPQTEAIRATRAMERMSTTELGAELLPAGSQIGAWRVVSCAGQGMFGTVYRVQRAEPRPNSSSR